MKYEVTRRGVYDAKGEMIEIGTEIDVKGDTVPGYLVGKSVPVKGSGKVAVTNPKDGALPAAETGPKGPFTVKDDGAGWHGVYDADDNKVKSLRKDDAEAFAGLSADDQVAFLTEA